MRKFYSFFVLLGLIFIQTISAQTLEEQSVREFNSGFVEKYSTKGETKSNDIDLIIKYPRSWKSIEGERPHVLRKFVQQESYVLAILMIKPLGQNVSQEEINSALSKSGLKATVPPNGIYVSSNSNLKIEGLKAGSLEYLLTSKRGDREFHVKIFSYVLFYKDNLIQLQFMVADKPNESTESVLSRYNSVKPLFAQMFNSIVINNIWNN